MDTTSLSFYGEGGETLGEHGYSKDYRPDLKQMILGLVVDGDGRPICTEMWPGNTADVTSLLPVVDRLRKRFSIGRVCVVADRGMISAATIAGLEERKLEYILGARERSDAVVRKIVLENDDPFVPLLVERKAGETQLFVKQVKAEGVRYVVCRNEAEAENDRNRYDAPTSYAGRLSETRGSVRQREGAHCMHQSRHDADSYQRVEVITGRRHRRDWSDDEKARILAESAGPEVNISEVARRNGVSRGLLNVWRRKARLASSEGPQFVQLRLDDGLEARPDATEPSCVVARPAERIEVTIAGATVRVPVGVDAATLERVLAAVRSTR